ncbi:alanine symporter family protein [Mycobacterium xenopi 4042]|uniref:Alanine symporter family protein n=1 Tax=Mycobacterium xenopi 4042 TaxID=1299334 RepID=X8CEW5_MYCXE|nr:alanine symporter family protein [Mycobacterium xenopi 4042]
MEANAISDVLKISHHVGVGWTAVILVALTAPIVFGGVRSVARVAGVVLPVVAMAYALLALVIVLVHIRNLPGFFTRSSAARSESRKWQAVSVAVSPLRCSMGSSAACLRTKRGWAVHPTSRPPRPCRTRSSRV